ncbi:hypothetical protein ACFQVC_11475 [Streptomyces monticola]|uniref:Lipoprotein n=1 Tax=Streptomyces monticola TaxID=2666263 RepID=A0ABW2JH69_9ACTN
MTRRRPSRAAVLPPAAALLVVCCGALTGCGSAGGLKSAGPTPSAVGPARLWPQLPPAKPDYPDGAEVTIEVVKGVKVPDGDLHKVDPLAVVKAEVEAHPDTYSGADALPEDTAKAIKECPDKKPGQTVKGCPVQQAYYRDLTGSGMDELIVGITFSDGSLGIRVYSLDGGKLIRIMSTSQPVTSVELAGRDLIIRSPAQSPGYEYRDSWSWDAQQHAMLPTRTEIVRVPHSGAPTPDEARPSVSRAPGADPS